MENKILNMITFEEAHNIVFNAAFTLDVEKVDMIDSLGRALAEDVISDLNMPPFDKSAMDGYACRKEDIKNELEVIEVIPAGKVPEMVIYKNRCSKIMTGAMVPEGSDCVIIVEHTEPCGDNKIRFVSDETANNICYKSEDIKVNDVVLLKGTCIRPQHIAVMATVGCVRPLVYKKPKVGIITTGEELVEPHEKPGVSEIRNSNAYQLMAQVRSIGLIPNYYGIVGDTEDACFNTIKKALDENDIIMLTGGVSMGDFDIVPEILETLNVKLHFRKVAVQPGRPTTFGTRDNKLCFGLPGNPVSSFIQFELLVKPAIYKMMGVNFKPPSVKLKMEKEYRRKKADRKSWIPVKINDRGEIMTIAYHGSGHINSLTDTDGIISLGIGKYKLEKGEIVDVRQI